ncbi:MAG: hypothetical protein V4581_10130 [Bacteroidota bacterium]
MPAKTLSLLLKACLIVLSIMLFSCSGQKAATQKFSITQDSLVINTQKHKGPGPFMLGAGLDLFKKDTLRLVLPQGIDSVLHYRFYFDFRALDNYADIISGYRDTTPVYIVDANQNRTFTDDTAETWESFEWTSPTKLTPITFSLSDGRKMVPGKSWLNIGLSQGNYAVGRSEHLAANFKLGKDTFTIGIAETRNPLSFTYGIHTQGALLAQNKQAKDSIKTRDMVALNNYFNLNGSYYRFEGISNFGERITLVKDPYYNSRTGVQAGMLAPAFIAVTIARDTINSASYNKYKIIANSCGCGGDVQSAAAAKEITNTYSGQALVLTMDTGEKLEGMAIADTKNPANRALYENYRGEYCSRLCYVIGPDNRIADIFEITEWKASLPKIIRP